MVVRDLDVSGPLLGPHEADSVLVVDPDRMLSGTVADQLLQPVPWWDAKVVDVVGRVKLTELFLRRTLYVRAEARGLFTIPDPLRRIVGKDWITSLCYRQTLVTSSVSISPTAALRAKRASPVRHATHVPHAKRNHGQSRSLADGTRAIPGQQKPSTIG